MSVIGVLFYDNELNNIIEVVDFSYPEEEEAWRSQRKIQGKIQTVFVRVFFSFPMQVNGSLYVTGFFITAWGQQTTVWDRLDQVNRTFNNYQELREFVAKALGIEHSMFVVTSAAPK